jgi:predicted phage-related endonuclease
MISATHTNYERTDMKTEVITRTEVTTKDEVAVLSPEVAEALIAEFVSTKAAIKALEAKKQEAEQKLRGLLGDAASGSINGVVRVRIQHRNLSKIDREMLKTAFPEAHEATLVQTSYTVLDAK